LKYTAQFVVIGEIFHVMTCFVTEDASKNLLPAKEMKMQTN